MRIVLAIVALVIAAAAASVIDGSSKWNRSTAERVARLSPSTPGVAVYHEAMLAGLPPPALRYFRRVLRDGQPIVRSAVARQEAEFFINGAWRPLRASQDFVAAPPGFVWDARITMAPLVPAYVRDSYVNGVGTMTASILGVYTLVDQQAIPELNAGALQRFLAEAVWLPTALLPSPAVTWSPRDDRSAVATLRDSSTKVSMTFDVDPEGLVTSINGDRFKESGGNYTVQPWQVRCDEYRDRDGMLIPLHCEVAWITDGRPEPYWRGRITSVSYRYN